MESIKNLMCRIRKNEEKLARQAIKNKTAWPYKTYPTCEVFCGIARVYTLSNKAGNVFYVGCTTQSLNTRLKGHFASCNNRNALINPEKSNLIVSLNYDVTITQIDSMYVSAKKRSWALSKAKFLELSWIKKYIEMGYPLVNRENKKLKKAA